MAHRLRYPGAVELADLLLTSWRVDFCRVGIIGLADFWTSGSDTVKRADVWKVYSGAVGLGHGRKGAGCVSECVRKRVSQSHKNIKELTNVCVCVWIDGDAAESPAALWLERTVNHRKAGGSSPSGSIFALVFELRDSLPARYKINVGHKMCKPMKDHTSRICKISG